MSDACIGLFTCLATIGFAYLGLAAASEIIRAVATSAEERRVFGSIFLLASILIGGSFIPLIFAEMTELWLLISMIYLSTTCTGAFILLVWQIAKRKVGVRFPCIFYPMMTIGGMLIVALIASTIWMPSVVLYKFALTWLALGTGVRFALFAQSLLGQQDGGNKKKSADPSNC